MVFGFFLISRNVHSEITNQPLENDKIVHRDEGLRRFFTPSVQSAQTKKVIGNDKTVHNKQGPERLFPSVFRRSGLREGRHGN